MIYKINLNFLLNKNYIKNIITYLYNLKNSKYFLISYFVFTIHQLEKNIFWDNLKIKINNLLIKIINSFNSSNNCFFII